MSFPAPFASDTPDLLAAGPLTHIVRTSAVMPDGETIPLDLEGGTLSFDETRSPRVIADNLLVKAFTDVAALGRVDPRTGCRLRIDAGYRRPDGTEDVQTIANLGLRSRPVSRPADTMPLSAQSDEALVIDNSPGVFLAFTRATTVLAIQVVVQAAGLTPTWNVTAPAGPAVTQGPYEDYWDLTNDLADRIGAQVYDDGLRTWNITTAPVLAATAAELAVGAGGTITSSESGLDRDEWANKVVLRYRWRDTSDVEHTIISTRRITSGPYAALPGNTKTLLVERSVSTTQAEADLAAAALVARTVTRGRSFTLSAVSAYWLRPGHTVLVTLPLGDPERHLVQSVRFDLVTGLMQVTTRLPDNTGTIGA